MQYDEGDEDTRADAVRRDRVGLFPSGHGASLAVIGKASKLGINIGEMKI